MRVRMRKRGGDWRLERPIRAVNGQQVLGWLVLEQDLAWWEVRSRVLGAVDAPLAGYCMGNDMRAIRECVGPAPVGYGPHVSITPVFGISPDIAWDLLMQLVGGYATPKKPTRVKGRAVVVSTECFDRDPSFWTKHISG